MKILKDPMHLVLATLSLATLVTGIVFTRPMISNIQSRHEIGAVEVYETTGNRSKLMARQNDLLFQEEGSGNTVISVDPSTKHQEVIGLGASLTHSSAYNINNSQYKNEMLDAFFSSDKGSAFNVLRLPIGSSDFTTYVDGEIRHFTLNDTENVTPDPELSEFNIDIDRVDLLPVLKEIQEMNDDLVTVSAPWSPPAWMKTSNSLYSGSLKTEYEEVYVEYLLKYLLSYEEEGVDIDYISIQNEPYHGNSTHPVMFMEYDQAIRISIMLGEAMQEEGLDTMIMGWDHNTDVTEYGLELLDDEKANEYISGIAFHGYYGDVFDIEHAFNLIHDAYPEKDLYFTEITAGDWSVDFANNISYSMQNVISGSFNNYGRMVLYWNLVLDEDNGPVLGGGDNSHGLFTRANNDAWFSKSAEYYALSHVSRFIHSDEGNARVIDVESSNEMIVASAFERADGRIVLVLTNMSDRFPETAEIHYGDRVIEYELQQQSVVTFVW